jgi:hypothetical protein
MVLQLSFYMHIELVALELVQLLESKSQGLDFEFLL